MQVALISPICQLAHVVDRQFQMILPEGLSWNLYASAYQGIKGKHFTILDNGMFESNMVDYEYLIQLAITYGASEIVMPDVRFDMEQTLEKVDEFLNMYTESDAVDRKIGLQIALQVSHMGEVPDFVHRAQELEWKHFGTGNVFTFGIPRRMVEKFGDQARLGAVDFIVAVCDNPIHLLGYARTKNPEFNETVIMTAVPQVRSIDTDAPFLWAAQSTRLETGTRIDRMQNYFTLPTHLFSGDLVRYNIDQLDRWAGA